MYLENWFLFRLEPYSITAECRQPTPTSLVARELLSITLILPGKPARQKLAVSVSREGGRTIGRITFWDKDGNPFRPSGAGSLLTKREMRTLCGLLDKAKALMKT